ncbi:uncharacterized protein LOC131250546 [Magnolia sinica]|uniref:uncharacterized protein LOC131250546 n=1 Tax=Magnolia sinica TaxID=86752 RepID=UPI0026586E6C|nr:uncharacterized protein LOC131250546 [Magnolia sinica]
MWCSHSGFQELVQAVWAAPLVGNPIQIVIAKLKAVKQALKHWNKTTFGNIFNNIQATLAELIRVEVEAQAAPGQDSHQNLQLAAAKSRRAVIQEIKLADGTLITNITGIREAAVDYFNHLLQVEDNLDAQNFLQSIPTVVSAHDNALLLAEPSLEELLQAVKVIPPNSAAGPDGFFRAFFQACWSMIQHDLLMAAKYFFTGAEFPRALTSSLICLIPKISAPVYFFDFRTISLCNCLYKIFSGIFASRLGAILPNIVSIEQAAFV